MPQPADDEAEARRRKHHLRDRESILRSMDQCTKCGICHAHCPVAAVTGQFPGPKYAGPQAQRFRVIEAGYERSPMLCNGCGVCTSVCPNDVAITDIITIAKAEITDQGRSLPIGQRLLNRPQLVGRIGAVFPWITNVLLNNPAVRRIIERLVGVHRNAPLPNVHGQKFNRWFATHVQPDGPTVSYFPGCAVGNYDPEVGIALVRLFNRLGYRIEVPTRLCCSLPQLSSGEIASATSNARALLEDLHPTARTGQPIISTSTSCSLTLRSKYAAYLDMTDEIASDVAGAVVDVCEFLLSDHVEQLQRSLSSLRLKVLYHGPCQLRGHRMGQPAVELLKLVPGLELVVSRADCCGIGGTYGYGKDKHEIALAIGKSLVDQIQRVKPDIIVCDSETCRWNIEKQTAIETIHPVQLLMRAVTV